MFVCYTDFNWISMLYLMLVYFTDFNLIAMLYIVFVSYTDFYWLDNVVSFSSTH